MKYINNNWTPVLWHNFHVLGHVCGNSQLLTAKEQNTHKVTAIIGS